MAAQLQAWVLSSLLYKVILEWYLTCDAVDLGGSLAVASRGLYATGVSTDINGKIRHLRRFLGYHDSSFASYIPQSRRQGWRHSKGGCDM